MAGPASFDAWARPDLVLPLGGRTYPVRPPSVETGKTLMACAVRAEINLGIVRGELSAELKALIDAIKPGEHPALGDTYHQLEAAGVDQVTIDRMAYYAVFYWAKGQEYADWIAELLWSLETDVSAGSSIAAPKG